MIKIKFVLVIFIFVISRCIGIAQTLDVQGQIDAIENVDGIHVINITSHRFSVSNELGRFSIPAKLNDTLVFSGLQYVSKEVVVGQTVLDSKFIQVRLEVQVTELDEIIVGSRLTGDLGSDMSSLGVEAPVNFYNLGIPGYTGVPKTQSERRLNEATTGSGLIPLNPILNAISGRTKELKARIKMEKDEQCRVRMMSKFTKALFDNNELDRPLHEEYFMFVAEDDRFYEFCRQKNDLEVFEFLKDKLEDYKIQLNSPH